MPSPQRATVQLALQNEVGSPTTPGSHCSPAARFTRPSPQTDVVQFRLQAALAPAGPGSHCSPASGVTNPSPHCAHTGGRQARSPEETAAQTPLYGLCPLSTVQASPEDFPVQAATVGPDRCCAATLCESICTAPATAAESRIFLRIWNPPGGAGMSPAPPVGQRTSGSPSAPRTGGSKKPRGSLRKWDTAIAQEERDLWFSDLSPGDSQDHFEQLIRVGLQPDIVQPEEDDRCRKPDPLVPVDERMVLHEVEKTSRGHLMEGRMQVLAAERGAGHRQGGLEQAEIANAGGPAIPRDLVGVDGEDLFQRKECWSLHSASLRKTPAYRSCARLI